MINSFLGSSSIDPKLTVSVSGGVDKTLSSRAVLTEEVPSTHSEIAKVSQ